MTDAELLAKIKHGLGITGTFQDDTLNVYIDEVKAFMRSAGVTNTVISSTASVGCIMRGVADLWNYGSGSAKLSDYFRMRVLQLRNTAQTRQFVPELADYTQSINVQAQTNSITFTYPTDLPAEYAINVFVNGILEEETAQYTINGNVISFTGYLTAGTIVTVKIYYVTQTERTN